MRSTLRAAPAIVRDPFFSPSGGLGLHLAHTTERLPASTVCRVLVQLRAFGLEPLEVGRGGLEPLSLLLGGGDRVERSRELDATDDEGSLGVVIPLEILQVLAAQRLQTDVADVTGHERIVRHGGKQREEDVGLPELGQRLCQGVPEKLVVLPRRCFECGPESTVGVMDLEVAQEKGAVVADLEVLVVQPVPDDRVDRPFVLRERVR